MCSLKKKINSFETYTQILEKKENNFSIIFFLKVFFPFLGEKTTVILKLQGMRSDF